MLIVNSQNIKQYHGAQLVLEDVTFDIHERERVGLVGRNGSGKTTLLRLLAKELKPDEGQLSIRKDTQIGYLAQVPEEWSESTVHDVLASGYRELLDCRANMSILELGMSDPEAAEDPDRLSRMLEEYAKLQERFEREGGYEMEARIDQIAGGLQIAKEFYVRRFDTLSGGEQTKIGLAAMLIRGPELLLLDEPTNHLDMAGVEWLETFIGQYDGTCLIVSHDRTFLDRVVTKIIDLEDGEAHTYLTNYTGYVKEKEEKLLQQFADYQEQQKQMKKMKETIRKLEEWGRVGDNEKFFRRAASMRKALDRMEKVKRPVLERKGAEFGLSQADRSGRKVIRFEGVTKSYGANPVLSGMNGELEYGDKIMLVGRNGSGKSTFIKLLLGEGDADEGTIEWGSRVEIGYLAQADPPGDGRLSVLAYFREEAGLEEGEARSRLAKYLFYGADVFKAVGQLSGGEWTRLRLALLMIRKPNLLILDEPTNHMDIASREALEEALEEFSGTLLAVTHDRYFINRLADKVWELDRGQVTVYLGGFDAYQEKRLQLQAGRGSSRSMGREQAPVAAAKRSASEPDESRVVNDARPGKAKAAAGQLEPAIAREESRLAELDARLDKLSGEPPEPRYEEELAAVWAEREAVQEKLDRLYEEWMLAQEHS
ncbi:ribosomal protection-like ABC-F family protein [Paenibacillus spongiae]|uniref:ABC-F family ATP-binding cassette domain-containing protein n=1 Tax=Paenibacillus spongiae TaxID=2909671 RepID=A0ABY5SBA2_9BACL|nr:ABC-F family ATP-binding cassette domain-containing protein [Paenibacillus spongiae]UVI30072.1 ABC-F family ATP-binding cassette domain-containing protein [Paenibacillus spongiae]